MALPNIDPELMQDFLTESGELLEQLDQTLVVLEGSPEDPEMLNQVFRALHTIKGSASFLALTNLVSIAHAAEGALNAARNRVVRIDRGAMDLLLAAVDIIKKQFEQLRAGTDLVEADAALVAGLTRLAEGHGSAPVAAEPAAPVCPGHGERPSAPPIVDPPRIAEPADCAGASTEGTVERPLNLGTGKADLLDFLVSDLEQTLDQVEGQLASLKDSAKRPSASESLAELAESLRKSVDFFDFEAMTGLAKLLGTFAERVRGIPAGTVGAAVDESARVLGVLRQQSKGLARGVQIIPPTADLVARFESLLRPESDDEQAATGAPVSEPVPPKAFESASPAAPSTGHVAATSSTAAATLTPNAPPTPAPSPAPSAAAKTPDASAPATANGQNATNGQASAGEATIRVEVGRLEALLNLVGELVLQKNRLGALTRQLMQEGLGSRDYREAVQQAAGGLERVTGDLQTAVMRTRMQPLDKLFGKYPRLVRDLARKLNKQITLEIEGGHTEVDKSVIEELGDPLVHLMRNAADHGIESPEARRAAGKSETGTIRLRASNTGGHVEIRISDDGKGLDPAHIARKAVEKGVATQADVDAMNDREKMRLVFLPGFSTAEQVSDVSGRGVGMDVVRTNIEKIKGTIDLQGSLGRGTEVVITIPLTVAIMDAMMVAVGDEVYAVPLSHVVEIVKPTDSQRMSINQQPVMRLRDGVLPLLWAGEEFGQSERPESPFVVVLAHNEKRAGLLVSRPIGQQEIVIKPLSECIDTHGPVSGATVRDDGGVSLIVDVPRLVQMAEERRRAA
ncbi:MAG: chemotaxis protein CheA [Phycisphaerae bacterium]|nr:chemotaxis protein CheA [Phycisphaerae bacterium]